MSSMSRRAPKVSLLAAALSLCLPALASAQGSDDAQKKKDSAVLDVITVTAERR